ncbi:MAG: hypothetical protein H0Z34_07055 [Brevibacillus sp.]|nr:hypothetical protein [Brevibacillus sp.]
MKQWITLAVRDLAHIVRDPLLMLVTAAPLLLALLIRFAVPWIDRTLLAGFSFSVADYELLLLGFLLLTSALMLGVLTGFLILDERDEGVLTQFAVTPLTRTGYVLYRLAAPVLFSSLLSLFVLPVAGGSQLPLWQLVWFVGLLSLESPLIALAMAAYAANKVEGLALAKVLSLFLLAPAVIYFVPSAWQYAAALLPSYWVAKAFFAAAWASGGYWIWLAGGVLYHLLLLRWLLRKFMQKVE